MAKKKLSKLVKEIEAGVFHEEDPGLLDTIDFENTLSTGSLFLDLAISGGRTKYGGIPTGIMVEIFGLAGSGKTAILAEVCASAQNKGGDILFLDPEARLDAEYARIYGVSIKGDNYHQPDTVEEVFAIIEDWDPEGEGPHVIACDSLAALSTEMEMEDGDKFGARRAKMFSQGFRKVCRKLKQKGWLFLCSNQVRENIDGYGSKYSSPGGQAIRFYSSLRIQVKQDAKLKRKITLESGKEIEKIFGIRASAEVVKSSIDDPYRTAEYYVVFGYGIDDLRANLQYIKTFTRASKYEIPGTDKSFKALEDAIRYVEENELEKAVEEEVISIWKGIEDRFKEKLSRKPKRRK